MIADIYCRNVTCPGYGTPKAGHAHDDGVARRSDGGTAQIPKSDTKTDPKRDESTSGRTTRHG